MTWTAADGSAHEDLESHGYQAAGWTHKETVSHHHMAPADDPSKQVTVDKRDGSMVAEHDGRRFGTGPDRTVAASYGGGGKTMTVTETKTDFDPAVGGGVDRDKIPAADFAGPHDTLPIVEPKDVHDAWVRANTVKDGDIDEMHARIKAIAKRKGDAFVAQLPDSANVKPSKAWVSLSGSYEATQALLGDALDRWMDQMFPGMVCWNWIEATFAGYAIVGVGYSSGDGDFDADDQTGCEFWKVPYTVDGDESVTLGEPSAIDIRGVAVDRPEDTSDTITFLPPANVVAKALSFKNASHLRRRYALLSHLGVDVSATGLTPEILATAPSGTATIPAAGSPDFRTGQSDLSTPGSVSDEPSVTQVPAQGSYLDDVGNMPGIPIPGWYQGTWYVDNAGNLMPVPVPGQGRYNSGLGNMPAPPVAPQGHYNEGLGNMGGSPVTEIGTSRDAGTLTLAGTERGETKAATRYPAGSGDGRRRKPGSLLSVLKAQKYRMPGVPVAAAGSKTAAPGDVETKILADMPTLIPLASKLWTAIKEGRMMSAVNAQAIADAHSQLGDRLKAAGVAVQPVGNEPFTATNAEGGRDENGVPIAAAEAKGLSLDEVMAWRAHAHQVEPGV